MGLVCWQMIVMNKISYFYWKLGKMLQNLSSAAVVIGALRVNSICKPDQAAPFSKLLIDN